AKLTCEIFLFQKNGAKGEKCGSISRGGEGINLLITERTPLFTNFFTSSLQNVPVERFEHSWLYANLTTAFYFSTY
ncbi:MAG: hypothetical protein IJ368_01755, partial [Oscillospiraceae bacterium]|nr:hypothetical protein [Oscillospiraceae bacterium]